MDVEGKGVLGTTAVEMEDECLLPCDKERANVETVWLQFKYVPVS